MKDRVMAAFEDKGAYDFDAADPSVGEPVPDSDGEGVRQLVF